MPCVSATMTPRMTMNAIHPPTSLTVSLHSAALVGGGRKNSAGRSFMLTRREFDIREFDIREFDIREFDIREFDIAVTSYRLRECTGCRHRSRRASRQAAAP